MTLLTLLTELLLSWRRLGLLSSHAGDHTLFVLLLVIVDYFTDLL